MLNDLPLFQSSVGIVLCAFIAPCIQELMLLIIYPLTPYFIHVFIYSFLPLVLCSFVLESLVASSISLFHVNHYSPMLTFIPLWERTIDF